MPQLDCHAYTLPPGVRGFDCYSPLTPKIAAAFKAAQFDFVCRYVWRESHNKFDLSYNEADLILDAGLHLVIVQHVHPDSEKPSGWTPTEALGLRYGDTAVMHAELIGLPAGPNVFVDWEGVARQTPKQVCVDFNNNWHSRLAAAGYVPGMYVGFGAVLNASELYRLLRTTHYWGAYNVQTKPSLRGYQIQQGEQPRERPAGVPRDFFFDVDTVQLDGLRGLPIALTRAVDGLFADVVSGSSSTVVEG
jgi:hypothetical protein